MYSEAFKCCRIVHPNDSFHETLFQWSTASALLIVSRESFHKCPYPLITIYNRFSEHVPHSRETSHKAAKITSPFNRMMPYELIYTATKRLGDWRVLGCWGDVAKANEKHELTPHTEVTNVQGFIRKNHWVFDPDRMYVVAGPSGSGKTVSVVSLSSHFQIVVYILPCRAISNEGLRKISAPISDEYFKKEARRAYVLEYVAQRVHSAVPSAVREAMIQMPRDGSRLEVVVFLDDMGHCTHAVKALCAMTGRCVKDKLVRLWGTKLPQVDFHLVVAGTGIGWSDKFYSSDYESLIGSQYTKGTFLSTESEIGTHKEINLAIFLSHFPTVSPPQITLDSLRNNVDPLFLLFILGNARFASCAGRYLAKSIGGAFDRSETKEVLLGIDLGLCLLPIAFDYWAQSPLKEVAPDALFEHLLQAVRMHYFPFAVDASAAHDFEVRTGLVQNLTLVRGWFEKTSGKKKSPIRLPSFSIALLSQLLGLSVVSRSVVSGERLETAVFGAFFLLACCSGGSDVFTAMLEPGVMGPMLEDDLTFGPIASLDSAFMYDFSSWRAEECDSCEDLAEDYRAKQRLGTSIADAVKMTMLERRLPTRVAVFRSPDEAAFADLFILMGDTMYLLRVRDVTSVSSFDVNVDRWKMGAVDANAKKAAEHYPHMGAETVRRPRGIIKAIAEAWTDITNVPVTHVRPYIVLPRDQCAREVNGKLARFGEDAILPTDAVAVMMHEARAVSVEGIEFLCSSRSDQKPKAATTSTPMRITHAITQD